MLLRYQLPNGKQEELKLKKDTITIGRSSEADLVLPDKLVTRVHCEISYSNNAYFLRDLKSRNGTFVNGRRVDMVRLNVGDKIRLGSTIIQMEFPRGKGAETVLKEVKQEMDRGKGYKTMLLEIIEEEKAPKE